MSALAEALKSAGHRSSQEQLDAIADAAFAQHPRTLDLARQYVLDAVRDDAALLWTLLERWHRPAADMLLQAAAARRRAKSEATVAAKTNIRLPPASGAKLDQDARNMPPQRASGLTIAGPSRAEMDEARHAVARVISKLDTFKVNGRPLGDCTAQEAMAWRASRVRDARFVYLAAVNLPPDRPIRDFITAAEIERLYQQAQAETANE
jgi:hypothetical protein